MLNKSRTLNKILSIISISSFLLYSGCLRVHTHLKGIEPNARPIENNYKVIKETEKIASGFKLLWFFPVTPPPDIQNAIDSAIVEEKGDNIINLRLWHERQYWIVGVIDIITVKGNVIRYTD